MRSTQLGWTAFLVAIASLTSSPASALTPHTQASNSVESRLARLQSTFQTKAAEIPMESTAEPTDVALGWANGRGGRGFVNGRRGGWGDGYRGGFGNINPWRNGWRDGGGFYNRRW